MVTDAPRASSARTIPWIEAQRLRRELINELGVNATVVWRTPTHRLSHLRDLQLRCADPELSLFDAVELDAAVVPKPKRVKRSKRSASTPTRSKRRTPLTLRIVPSDDQTPDEQVATQVFLASLRGETLELPAWFGEDGLGGWAS